MAEALKSAKYFAVFLSADSFTDIKDDSKFLEEIRNALEYKREIVPILQEQLNFREIEEDLVVHGIEKLKKYQAVSLIHQFNGMESCANAVNHLTTPERADIPDINIDMDIVRKSLNELPDGPYKEAVEEYYRETYCEICDPENPFANFVEWSGYGANIDRGEEFVENIGRCNFCNAIHVKCSRCGSITSLFADATSQDCEGHCGVKFDVVFNARESEDILSVYEME